jgi:hypothetical protein
MKVKCPADLLININFSHKLKNLSEGIKINDLINSFMIVDQAQRDLQRNRNIDLMMENTLLALKRLNHGFSQHFSALKNHQYRPSRVEPRGSLF